MQDLVLRAHSLRDIVHEHTAKYRHSRPVIRQQAPLILHRDETKHTFHFSYGIKDLLLMGAMTQSHVLMTGPSDVGKTMLAKLFMNSLFGEEGVWWHKINVDIEISRDMGVDTDYGVIREGGTSSEAYRISKHLLLPGLILDELNRGHAKQTNVIMHYFDGDINLPNGKRGKIGYPYDASDGSKRYQFIVTAINEGDEFTGTFDIDKAMRRRTTIEIPMGEYLPTPKDHAENRSDESHYALSNHTSHLDDVLALRAGLCKLRLHPNSDLYLAFLTAFDYCEYSLTKQKRSVPAANGSIYHICTKPPTGAAIACPFLRSFENDLCPHITGITPGIVKNLINVARGAALLRAVSFGQALDAWAQGRPDRRVGEVKALEEHLRQYTATRLGGKELARAAFHKYVNELTVRPEDIDAVFGFVAYTKIGLAAPWITKHYQGNRTQALRAFVRQAQQKFEEGVAKLIDVDLHNLVGNAIGAGNGWTRLKEYCDRYNPWFGEAIEPYAIDKKDRCPEGAAALAYLYQ
jgi:hypothetical protein